MATSTRYPEIDYEEVKEAQEIGYGSFGTVYKATWRNRTIAVKQFRSEVNQDKIEKELKNLCRVTLHPHIVDVYGVSKLDARIFLIMEYASCGSLQKFLHNPPKYDYTEAHALNWMLQCAEAVEYLHTMDPKPLLHRDLKPANLLLTNECRNLKICDFGTVAEFKTHMTQAKGSVPWMAPEVLSGSTYTEKCDVYSFGIILWEVFARQQPFEGKFEIELAIGYHVIKGGRPELNETWPEKVKTLIKGCWDKEPEERPNMNRIVRTLKDINKNFAGGDAPLGVFSKVMLQPDQSDDEVAEGCGQPNSLDLIRLKIGFERSNSAAAYRSEAELCLGLVSEKHYLVRKERAGFILIICQTNYFAPLHCVWRHGIPNYSTSLKKDQDNLRSTFSSFGYIPIAKSDCTSSEIITFLKETVQMSENYDSLIVCILSQIANGFVCGTDGVPVYLSTFQDYINSGSLKEKPKMLIVQRYQTSESQTITNIKTDVFETKPSFYKNMLTICAFNLNFSSFGSLMNGSGYIKIFCEHIHRLGDRMHMINILYLLEKSYNEKACYGGHFVSIAPQKDFYLPKRTLKNY